MSHNSQEVKLQVSNEEYEDHSFFSVPAQACSAIRRAEEYVLYTAEPRVISRL